VLGGYDLLKPCASVVWSLIITYPCHALLAFQLTFGCNADLLAQTGQYSVME